MTNQSTTTKEALERLAEIKARYSDTATPQGVYEVRANDLAWLIQEIELSRVSAPIAPVVDWQPAETAPKETEILMAWEDGHLQIVYLKNEPSFWFENAPTHWAPLPAGPSAAPASTVAPQQSEPWRDEGGHEWERRANVECVECPHCCFIFAAVHTDGNSNGYSCPNCQGCPDAPASTVAPQQSDLYDADGYCRECASAGSEFYAGYVEQRRRDHAKLHAHASPAALRDEALDEAIKEAENDLRVTCPEMFAGKPLSIKRGSE